VDHVLGSVIGIGPPAEEVVAVQIPRLSNSFPQRRSPPSARAAANAAFTFSWCVFHLRPSSSLSAPQTMSTSCMRDVKETSTTVYIPQNLLCAEKQREAF
jgi:hypothetical protein